MIEWNSQDLIICWKSPSLRMKTLLLLCLLPKLCTCQAARDIPILRPQGSWQSWFHLSSRHLGASWRFCHWCRLSWPYQRLRSEFGPLLKGTVVAHFCFYHKRAVLSSICPICTIYPIYYLSANQWIRLFVCLSAGRSVGPYIYINLYIHIYIHGPASRGPPSPPEMVMVLICKLYIYICK